MQRLRLIPRIVLGVSCVLAIAGCGQFFPSSNSITALSVAPSNATVAPGVTQQYTATATYGNNTTADVTSSVTWSTSQSATATISSTGLLTGAALGTCIVKAQSGNVIASTNVTVATKQVSSVTIAPLTPTLSLSGPPTGPNTVTFTATATYKDGSMGDVSSVSTWTSSDTSVATISSTGVATAVKVGNTNITATSGGVTSNTAAITVIQ